MRVSAFVLGVCAAWVLAAAALAQPMRLPDTMPPRMGPAAPKVEAVTLKLHLINGSKDGPVLANEKVTLELYHQGTPIKKYDLVSDAAGLVTLEKIPFKVEVEPVFTIQHAGLMQQAELPIIDGTRAEYEHDVKVFETTATRPAWKVKMRHVIVERNPETGGLQVMEMIAVENPIDRAWLGPASDPRGPVTFELALPSAKAGVTPMAGFPQGKTNFADGQLVCTGPMFPGLTRYQVGYVLPVRHGKATLTVLAPAATEHMMVLLPTGLTVQAQGLESQGVQNMGRGELQTFMASGQQPGQSASLALSGLAGASEGGLNKSGWMVITGGVVMVLIAAGVMMLRRPKVAANPNS